MAFLTMTLSLAELKTGVKRRRMYFQSVGGITNMFWLYILGAILILL